KYACKESLIENRYILRLVYIREQIQYFLLMAIYPSKHLKCVVSVKRKHR
ncbi:MAG: hypothetical protein PWP66_589, partial [Thermosediminibacterales bacterium]|nr:hypothetical protein [Thermosediminibacterales bacterium]